MREIELLSDTQLTSIALFSRRFGRIKEVNKVLEIFSIIISVQPKRIIRIIRGDEYYGELEEILRWKFKGDKREIP